MKIIDKFLLFFLLCLIPNVLNAEIGDLDTTVQESMSNTISQVQNINLGEAQSELAQGIDDAMGEMSKGMEFALEALENGDAEIAIRTIEMLEATMDMAIGGIPKEEFMDFSKVKFDDFSPEELAAAQSMMGDMMTDSMADMSKMMENMDHVQGAGFDVQGFMSPMDDQGFGFEKMFGDNMEKMSFIFGKDMNMMDEMVGGDIFGDGKGFGDFEKMMDGHESMDFGDIMENMDTMGDMSKLMSEQMNFENFSDMADMMDSAQMDQMSEGMAEMLEHGTFDHFSGNMEIMGAMIKGDMPEGMDKKNKDSFFIEGEQDEMMMNMMDSQVDQIGISFDELSPDQQSTFMQEAAESAWIGTGTADMSGFDSSFQGEKGPEFGEDTGLGMGDGMGAGGKPMFGNFSDGGAGDVFGDGKGFGDMEGGAFESMGESMDEAFGDSSGDGGMFGKEGPDTGLGMGDGMGSGGKSMGGGSCEGGGCD